MHLAIILGAAGLLYLVLGRSSSTGAKGAGIGGAANRNGPGKGIQGTPFGQIATSVASLGSSIFGGAGTHNPVDSAVKPPNVVGGNGTGGMIFAGSKDDPTISRIPSSSQVVTQLDDTPGGGVTGMIVTAPDGPEVSPDDFNVDYGG